MMGQKQVSTLKMLISEIIEAIKILDKEFRSMSVAQQKQLVPKQKTTEYTPDAWIIQAKISDVANQWNHDFQDWAGQNDFESPRELPAYARWLGLAGRKIHEQLKPIPEKIKKIRNKRIYPGPGLKQENNDMINQLNAEIQQKMEKFFFSQDWKSGELGLFDQWFTKSGIDPKYKKLVLYEFLID